VKIIRIIIILVLFLVLIIGMIEFPKSGGSGSAKSEETTRGSIDLSPVPANSEFLTEQSE
jgi:hypothetical protein